MLVVTKYTMTARCNRKIAMLDPYVFCIEQDIMQKNVSKLVDKVSISVESYRSFVLSFTGQMLRYLENDIQSQQNRRTGTLLNEPTLM